MSRSLILGTAGHIDHGKTSLVQALTGINCDRLPEEKARGITIDIGFASLDLGEVKLGIVDVPGHERFIKNMLAGATGFDLAMLVIAADDSIMPQTREHLEILSLLGLRHGVIALTKADTVDETTREVVELEIRDLVKDTFLESAPIVPTSAKTGSGIEELKTTLKSLSQSIAERNDHERFRMPIDRSFIVQGHGTVVTGTVVSGLIKVGDEIDWHTANGRESVRIRGLNQHGKAVESVTRGQRAAINLAGVPHESVRRGQELASPGFLDASRVVTLRLHALPTTRHPLRHRLPCRLHIGTQEAMGTLSILDCDKIMPGQWAITQFFSETPITSVWGQPFVIRDSSAEHTLGGGQILQPGAIKLRRRHIDSLQRAEQLWSSDESTRVAIAAWFAGMGGLHVDELDRLAGVPVERVKSIVTRLTENKTLIEWPLPGQRTKLVHQERWHDVEQYLINALRLLHKDFPLLTNHDRSKVVARLEFINDDSFLQSVIDRLLKSKLLVGDSKRIALAEFKPKLSINQRKLKDKIVTDHQAAGLTPPDATGYVSHVGGNLKSLGEIYEVAVAEGLLSKISPEIYLAATVEEDLRSKVRSALIEKSQLTVAEIRDLLGTTRKYAVPICEYLDKIGLTKRQGDQRILADALVST